MKRFWNFYYAPHILTVIILLSVYLLLVDTKLLDWIMLP